MLCGLRSTPQGRAASYTCLTPLITGSARPAQHSISRVWIQNSASSSSSAARAAISEPIKPIVYWVDPATPTKWVESVRRGIEQWQPAFEAAGFRNGIIGKIAPTPEEDPDWSPEDARYSVIRWLPSTTENASGPHISDPRTGEILEADVQFYHNVLNLARDWYWVQVGALDPRARTLPLPDNLMGTLIEYIVAHEVGHTLGFQHNMKASSQYTLDQVRDRDWVKKMGHTPTLMDYSRFNYVAQPEDNIDLVDLVPKIGPYDTWATMWGYKPIPGARTPDEEKKTLDEWARVQDATPWLRFTTAGAGSSDPGNLTEAVGDANAVDSFVNVLFQALGRHEFLGQDRFRFGAAGDPAGGASARNPRPYALLRPCLPCSGHRAARAGRGTRGLHRRATSAYDSAGGPRRASL